MMRFNLIALSVLLTGSLSGCGGFEAGSLSLGSTVEGFKEGSAEDGPPVDFHATFTATAGKISVDEALKQLRTIYRQYLAREADDQGLTYYLRQYYFDNRSLNDIRLEIANSDEARIRAMYNYHLRREPDAPGMKHWLSVKQSGKSLEEVRSNFRRAVECKVDCLPPAVVPAGFFQVPNNGAIYYSNGVNAFCGFRHWGDFVGAGGAQNLTNVNQIRDMSLVNNMANQGVCQNFLSDHIRFSIAGPIAGKHCISMNEPSTPANLAWGDNFLCSDQDYGIRWSIAGAIPGMSCTQINEPAEPASHAWGDNYLCAPTDLGLRFSYAGPIPLMRCISINEPSDPHTWADNYLCTPL